ncbi:L-lactate transporter-like [Pollicipes pollicipes]|uniref:L-lactate transporter-like n=1 Tax=Pollicipes pollicipes TaxID=41117 RepID=UPI0018854FBB|nr:L-lactate transporter-like [Pollicipes pollicipes]XP_037084345.1 L-lactate transporter-like [Pollicipes pollicipes]
MTDRERVLYERCGPRLVVLLGSVVASGATALTSVSVKTSLMWVIMTYGVMNGVGMGLVYTVPLLVGCKWFPNSKGRVSGILTAGFGLSGMVFTAIQTSFINPDNVSTEEDGFFRDAALLDRVPKVFLLQAGLCGLLRLYAFSGFIIHQRGM